MPALRHRRIGRLRAAIGALAVLVAGAAGPADTPVANKRILLVPPIQWDATMLSYRPALHQSASDLAGLTGGIVFGMTPADANAALPEPSPGVTWSSLPIAAEFPEDVRYFWIRLAGAQALEAGVSGCGGASSYIVFLFRQQGLFRMSYRFVADAACRSVGQAATGVFARYLQLDSSVVQAVHYRSGGVEVVDVTDPTAGYLVPLRWQNRNQ